MASDDVFAGSAFRALTTSTQSSAWRCKVNQGPDYWMPVIRFLMMRALSGITIPKAFSTARTELVA
jgi:hypothetical protein